MPVLVLVIPAVVYVPAIAIAAVSASAKAITTIKVGLA